MRRVTQRANDRLGTGWTLHDLRHTAARRMMADPAVSLTDVQWVLGHAHLTTTAIYIQPDEDEVSPGCSGITVPATSRWWRHRSARTGPRFSSAARR